jgi:ankyrin repeat protein
MGHLEVACWLLDHGADIDLADNGQRSAAFYAAKMGNVEMVQVLLARGAGALEEFVWGWCGWARLND